MYIQVNNKLSQQITSDMKVRLNRSLKMKEAGSYKTFVLSYQTTRLHISVYGGLNTRSHQNPVRSIC